MRSTSGSLIFVAIMLLVDWYVFMAVKTVSHNLSPKARSVVFALFWIVSILSALFIALLPYVNYEAWQRPVRTYIFAVVIGLFLAKLVSVFFFLIDDIRRGLQWLSGKLFFKNTEVETISEGGINRSTFLSWLGLGMGTTLFATLIYGFRNQYNYQVKKVKLAYDNLPAAFKGLKIIHISDIHSGSFMDVKAVQHGVDLINQQGADLILFTGDLVNDKATEMKDYVQVFNKLKAPMGVFSTLGNHDYGDYVQWPDRDAAHMQREMASGTRLLTPLQQKNLDELKGIHATMGWRLLMDEHVLLEKGGEKIALLGVQNISGKVRFHSYGNMAKAYAGSEDHAFKILMSHDPSHWDKEVRPKFPDVDLMLSGHTHGMQFGLQLPWFKWSPIQFVYKQWAGLYEDGKQKLYVNPGYGFIGYPGRVGILPEITVIELA
ncbi:MAG: metallophosphoesterase [Chitinophagaceae bacterium]